jgi:hypothetical protein
MRKKARELRYTRNVVAWTHLRNVLSSGRKNRGRLIFMLRGFIRRHPPETWCNNTVELFASFARVGKPESFEKKVNTLVEAFKQVSLDCTRVAVEKMRSFEASEMKNRKWKANGLDEFGKIGIIRTIADSLEMYYGPWNKVAA